MYVWAQHCGTEFLLNFKRAGKRLSCRSVALIVTCQRWCFKSNSFCLEHITFNPNPEYVLLYCNRYEKEIKDMFDFIYHSAIITKQHQSSIITEAMLLSPLCDKSKLTTYSGTPNRDTIKKIQIAFITFRFQACRKRQLKLASVLLYSLLCCSI